MAGLSSLSPGGLSSPGGPSSTASSGDLSYAKIVKSLLTISTNLK